MGKRTAQKDTIIDITDGSQVNSNFPYRFFFTPLFHTVLLNLTLPCFLFTASLHLGGDTSSVDLGTDVFKMSLQTELASQLGISEVVLLNFEVSLSGE